MPGGFFIGLTFLLYRVVEPVPLCTKIRKISGLMPVWRPRTQLLKNGLEQRRDEGCDIFHELEQAIPADPARCRLVKAVREAAQ